MGCLVAGAGCVDDGGPVGSTSTAELSPLQRIEELLRADTASAIDVRVTVPHDVVVPGDPFPRLVDMLEDVTDKVDGASVDLTYDEVAARDWTLAELEAEVVAREQPVDAGIAAIEVLVVRGDYVDNDDVLGLSWEWSRIVLFADALEAACASAGGGGGAGDVGDRVCEASWATILRHEAGHVLGLVNKELPMVADHEDPEHEHHDPDPDCLMYWSWDRSDVSGKVADEDLELCPASLADLAAARDAEPPLSVMQ